jgi:hypothetical protein
MYICDMISFKGVKILKSSKQNLPAGSVMQMTDSSYINDPVFLERLQHFQKYRASSKWVLILDRYTSRCSLEALNHCQQHETEMLCLEPHMSYNLLIEI